MTIDLVHIFISGMKVQAQDFGLWCNARILEVQARRCYVTYEGYSSEFDNYLPKRLIRKPLAERQLVRDSMRLSRKDISKLLRLEKFTYVLEDGNELQGAVFCNDPFKGQIKLTNNVTVPYEAIISTNIQKSKGSKGKKRKTNNPQEKPAKKPKTETATASITHIYTASPPKKSSAAIHIFIFRMVLELVANVFTISDAKSKKSFPMSPSLHQNEPQGNDRTQSPPGTVTETESPKSNCPPAPSSSTAPNNFLTPCSGCERLKKQVDEIHSMLQTIFDRFRTFAQNSKQVTHVTDASTSTDEQILEIITIPSYDFDDQLSTPATEPLHGQSMSDHHHLHCLIHPCLQQTRPKIGLFLTLFMTHHHHQICPCRHLTTHTPNIW